MKDPDIDSFCILMIFREALKRTGTPKQWESKEIATILDGLTDKNGEKLLQRYEKSGQIKRFSNEKHKYGRQKAWVYKNTPSEQFVEVSEDEIKDIPFIE